MDIAELVNTVVGKVLEQLQQQPERGMQPNCVLVLGERSESTSARIQAVLGSCAHLVYWGEDVSNQSITRYIVPLLSCGDMADLAIGRASSPVMQTVLQLLLAGTTVEVLDFAYTAHSETAPGPLYALYSAHEQTLATYGLLRVRPKQPDAIRFRHNLVTATDVSQVGKTGASVLMVPQGATITPLATEIAGNLHITILKRL